MEKFTTNNVLSENAILEILKTYFEGVGDLCEDMLRANVEKASAGGFSEEDRSIPVEMAVYFLEHFAVIYSALIHNEGIRDIFVEAINIEQMLDEVDEASAEKIRNKLCGPRDQEGEEEYVVINLGIYDDDIYRMISRIIENSFIRYKRIASDKETVYACKKLSDKDREDIGFCICNFMYLIRAFAKQQSFSDKVHVIMHDMDKAVSEWETNPEISLFDNTAVNTDCIDEDHEKNEGLKGTVDLGNPRAIYEYLLSRVYKQDDYCRDAAMILYNHINGMTSTNIVCGPSGSGKTYVWECLREIYPKIIIVNSATLTKDGWTGGNKVTSFLNQVDPEDPECIIVFDEFDKCAAPQYCAGGNNVSASIQSEFLKMVEGEVLPGKGIGIFETLIDTSDMSFVLCGSFAQKAREISRKKSSNGFGFETKHNDVREFDDKLTMDDIIDFGVIPELASRAKRLSNVRPLTLEDYCYLITEHEASPLKSMEKQYNIKLSLSKKKCEEIAIKAFESGLGVRNAVAQLQRIFDDMIFEEYKKVEVKPCAC